MGAVAAALFAGLIWLALPSTVGPMGYLFTDLDPSSAQGIADRLQADGVPHQLSPDGTAVLAPQSRLAELRMSLASSRMGGKIGYDVLDSEQSFGLSPAREKLNETRAIEGELARSVQSLQNVHAARIHIVMPDRELFATQTRGATAAVTVKTLGRLSNENVQAIRYLVASAVPELSPDAVSVIDQTGALLARAGETGAGGAGDADEKQQQVEAKLRQQIESLLEPIVGAGKVRAEVAAVIDRDQTREEASVVDPDKQAIAKQVTVESNDQDQQGVAGGAATSVSQQLPDAQVTGGGGGGSGDQRGSARTETSEDTTYENSRTSTVKIRPPGDVKRLTVAVMVDGGAQGLPAAQVERLKGLVQNAVGFDSQRGDSIVVEAMKFAPADAGAEQSFLSNLATDQIFSVLKVLVVAAIAFFAMRMLRPSALPEGAARVLSALPGAQSAGSAIEGPGGLALAAPGTERGPAAVMLDQEIALAEVDGKLKASAIKRIGETVAASPAEATSVVRQWMSN
ncbi:flagellar M-ring protein FliF [Sphingomonas sp. KRR8]|uniref:flagellar basal-body MS-ring/collar protein FliF n=1 Tax=Sphingomonas sp. KRR8 TaxID=2942996 RepID=UPI002021581F|nr:flagellar basal-body MS-ring/collar protein FliF [Sphingomonas sp. KRR8]URD62300.1 flagellar M-ring protein FliF [Sphingomonas sp. KRR8]